MQRAGRAYAAGDAEGPALVLQAPLSFYGGVAVATGEIVDRSHPDLGKVMAGRILVIPGGRGSSSSSSVLAEAIRLRTAPAGIVLARADPIMVVACLVAQRLYGLYLPMMVCPIEGIADGDPLHLACTDHGDATLSWSVAAAPERCSPPETGRRPSACTSTWAAGRAPW